MRIYIVKAGDTLSSIAEKYGLELAQLLALNPQITDPDNITPGMKIKIAVGPVSIAPGQPETGHPINPVGQETETPFMQFPVPAVEAGGDAGTGGQSGGMYGQPEIGSAPSGVPGGQTGGGTTGTGGTAGMGDITGAGGMTGIGGVPGSAEYGGYPQGSMSGQGGTPGMGGTTGTGGSAGMGDITGAGGMTGIGAVPGSAGYGGYPQGSMSGQGGTPGMGGTTGTGGTAGMGGTTGTTGTGRTPGMGDYNDAGDVDDSQPYLSTIPQNFAGNPMYSGVETFGDLSNVQGTTHNQVGNVPTPQLSMSTYGANMQGLAFGDASNLPTNMQSQITPLTGNMQNVGLSGADNLSTNLHMPYSHLPAGQQYPLMHGPLSLSTGGTETYTWSTPFDYMTANQANLTLSSMPNQLPNYPPNIAVSGSAGQLPVKKPCGCGGRASVGYYSLAEKRRAEEAAQATGANNESEALTLSEEARIAALERRVESITQDTTESVQAPNNDQAVSAEGSTGTDTIKNTASNKRSRSRNRKRTAGQKKSSAKAHLHGIDRSTRSPSGTSKSKPWLSV